MSAFAGKRRRWNFRRLIGSGHFGGYQYSDEFLAEAERFVDPALRSRTVISFHHHFPRASTVIRGGGSPTYYLDAVLQAELEGLAIPLRLSSGRERALAIERDNLEAAEKIFTMARWLKDYLVATYGIRAAKIQTVAPGANIDLPEDWKPIDISGGPFVLGLVGSDWRRKGLEFMLRVAERMERAKVSVRVRAIGADPRSLPQSKYLEAPGFVEKRTEAARFCQLLASCNLGCLFSAHEAYGISILEFLRLGVPVAGFLREGIADTIPPDAGFGFRPDAGVEAVAERLVDYARDAGAQASLRARAREWAPLVTWDRCAGEIEAILKGDLSGPRLQPWRGFDGMTDSFSAS